MEELPSEGAADGGLPVFLPLVDRRVREKLRVLKRRVFLLEYYFYFAVKRHRDRGSDGHWW